MPDDYPSLRADLIAAIDKLDRWQGQPTLSSELAKVVQPPPPPPPPPPPTVVAALVRIPFDLSTVVAFAKNAPLGQAYTRFDKVLVLTQTVTVETIHCTDRVRAGAGKAFPLPRYAIEVAKMQDNGVLAAATEIGAFVPAGTSPTVKPTLTLTTETSGWYRSEIVGYNAAGARVPGAGMVWWIIIDRDGLAKNSPWTVRQSGNYDWVHAGGTVLTYVVYPKGAVAPRPQPLPQRLAVTPNGTLMPPSAIARVALVGPFTDNGDSATYYPTRTKGGVLVSANQPGYEPSGMFATHSLWPMKGGERGIARTPYPLAADLGRNGKVYGLTPWSMFVADTTGTVQYLVGPEHAGDPPYWEDAPTSYTDPRYIIHGDWDPAIPVEQRFIKEGWKIRWDPRSLEVDLTAPLIGGEPPHKPYTRASGEVITGPCAWVVDAFNRLLEFQFSGTNRAAPAKIKLRLTGLADSWSLAITGINTIAISERGAHRVSEWNTETWTKVRDIVSDPGAAVVGMVSPPTDSRRRFKWATGQSLTTARARTVCGPEGLDCLYSHPTLGRWLYIGSLAKGGVERVHLDTGAREWVCTVPLSFGGVGPYFINFAVSDGSFYPAGSVSVVDYQVDNAGKPDLYLPNGTRAAYQVYAYGIHQGGGGNFNGAHYRTAVSIKDGRMACADSAGAINVFCAKDAYDLPIDAAKAAAGYRDWINGGHSTEHGAYAGERTTNPLPWGKTANLDYWMTNVLRLAR